MAVFTDGFAFHRGATDADSLKRMALVRAGFLVWSLTWHDLEFVFGGTPDVPDLLAGAPAGDGMAALQRTLDRRWDTADLRSRLAEPTLALLARYLRAPEPGRWKQAVFTALFGLFERRDMLGGARRAAFDRAAADALPGQVREALDDLPAPVAVGGAGSWTGTAPASFDLFAAFPLAAVERGDPDAAAVVLHLRDDPASRGRDGYRRVWNGVLRLFALLQFLPGAWWTTRTGVERGLYPEFPPPAGAAAGPAAAGDGSGTGPSAAGGTGPPAADREEEAAALAAPAARPLLAALSARGAPVPEVGFELADDRGAVLAEAELAWPASQVAVLLPGRETDAAAFEAAGWQVFAAVAADAAPAVAAALS